MIDLGRKAIENVRRAIEDPRHPRNVETSRWLLDRIAFRPEAAQVEVRMNVISAEVVQQLREPSIALRRCTPFRSCRWTRIPTSFEPAGSWSYYRC
jgi:hypothetical protein